MRLILILVTCISISFLASCNDTKNIKQTNPLPNIDKQSITKHKNLLIKEKSSTEQSFNLEKFTSKVPQEWGEQVTGVKTRFQTDEKEIALTFDACGGDYGSGYDTHLIEFLRTAKVPATLFVNERWIFENES